jgi:hypothetical protein
MSDCFSEPQRARYTAPVSGPDISGRPERSLRGAVEGVGPERRLFTTSALIAED